MLDQSSSVTSMKIIRNYFHSLTSGVQRSRLDYQSLDFLPALLAVSAYQSAWTWFLCLWNEQWNHICSFSWYTTSVIVAHEGLFSALIDGRNWVGHKTPKANADRHLQHRSLWLNYLVNSLLSQQRRHFLNAYLCLIWDVYFKVGWITLWALFTIDQELPLVTRQPKWPAFRYITPIPISFRQMKCHSKSALQLGSVCSGTSSACPLVIMVSSEVILEYLETAQISSPQSEAAFSGWPWVPSAAAIGNAVFMPLHQ